MYKRQMQAQKILCLLAVIVAVILFLYALGFMTDLYDTLYTTLRIKVEEGGALEVKERSVPGAKVYTDMQSLNQVLVGFGIAYILLAVLLFVTNTNVRRRYYIANYISVGLFAAASFYIPLYTHSYIEYFKAKWLAVDFEALKTYSETYGTAYTESTFWFDLHYVVYGLMFLMALLMIGNVVWKVLLMRGEKKLLAQQKEVSTHA